MTRTEQLQIFMEAVELQTTLDTLRAQRRQIRARYLSAPIHKSTKILENWMRINDVIDQISSDLFSVLSANA